MAAFASAWHSTQHQANRLIARPARSSQLWQLTACVLRSGVNALRLMPERAETASIAPRGSILSIVYLLQNSRGPQLDTVPPPIW